MPNAFISYSSKYNNYVVQLVKRIGPRLIVDYKSFEAAEKISDEISFYIKSSDIFVLLISDSALNSEWVINEIEQAKVRLDEGALYRVMPIIVDDKITHDDPRIPQWLKSSIIKLLSPGKLSLLISRKLKDISWNKHPKLREKHTIFVGRNEEIQLLESRLDDIAQGVPFVLVASGLPGIGRKRLLHRALLKSNIIKSENIELPLIILDYKESIEDFIIKMNDLGLGRQHNLEFLIDKSISAKLDIAQRMVEDIVASHEIIQIEDFGSIVLRNGEIVDWFSSLVSRFKNFPERSVTFCLSCRHTPKRGNIQWFRDGAFHIALDTLDSNDRSALLNRLLRVDGKRLSLEEFKSIDGFLSGFPAQLHAIASVIDADGVTTIVKNPRIATDFHNELFLSISQEIDKDDLLRTLVDMFTEIEYMSTQFIYDLIGGTYSEQQIDDALILLYSRSLINYFGVRKEFVRMNDGVRGYLKRNGRQISVPVKIKLKEYLTAYMVKQDLDLEDMSKFFYTLRGMLLADVKHANKFLIPSHYLKTMMDLYHIRRSYKDVVIVAKRVLMSARNIDYSLAWEIKYWYCMALARLGDQEFLDVVQFCRTEGNMSQYEFLLGFYYRMVGKLESALACQTKALELQPRFPRAQNEMVQILLGLEQYDDAISLAENNYRNETNNPYHIQAYFNCLIHSSGSTATIKILEELLAGLRRMKQNRRAIEILSVCESDYYTLLMNNPEEALRRLIEFKHDRGATPFVIEKMFRIAERKTDTQQMEALMQEFENSFDAQGPYEQSLIAEMKSKCFAHNGRRAEAFDVIDKTTVMSRKYRIRLTKEVTEILSNK